MIRLTDLLSERVEYFSSTRSEGKFIKALEEIQKVAKALGNRELLYRGGGFSGTYGGSALKQVFNQRTTYRGFTDDIYRVLKGLKAKFKLVGNIPVFVTPDKSQAEFFGTVHIFIPPNPDSPILQSSLINDLTVDMSEGSKYEFTSIKDLVDSYELGWPKLEKNEAIADVSEYYLINPKQLASSKPSKWEEEFTNPKTYADLADIIGKQIWWVRKTSQARKDAGIYEP